MGEGGVWGLGWKESGEGEELVVRDYESLFKV